MKRSEIIKHLSEELIRQEYETDYSMDYVKRSEYLLETIEELGMLPPESDLKILAKEAGYDAVIPFLLGEKEHEVIVSRRWEKE